MTVVGGQVGQRRGHIVPSRGDGGVVGWLRRRRHCVDGAAGVLEEGGMVYGQGVGMDRSRRRVAVVVSFVVVAKVTVRLRGGGVEEGGTVVEQGHRGHVCRHVVASTSSSLRRWGWVGLWACEVDRRGGRREREADETGRSASTSAVIEGLDGRKAIRLPLFMPSGLSLKTLYRTEHRSKDPRAYAI